MKVTMSADYKKHLTVEEVEIAKQIIKDFKTDESTVNEYAEMAIRSCSFGWIERIYEAKATIEKNRRSWNAYNDDSRNLDVWIEATAQTSAGFLIVGAYLTDIWNITGSEDDAIHDHIFVRKFAER